MTGELASLVEAAETDRLLDVIVELEAEPWGDRNDEDLGEWFERVAELVATEIRQLGGEVTGAAWINQTLRARLPATRVRELSKRAHVRALDVPRPITLD